MKGEALHDRSRRDNTKVAPGETRGTLPPTPRVPEGRPKSNADLTQSASSMRRSHFPGSPQRSSSCGVAGHGWETTALTALRHPERSRRTCFSLAPSETAHPCAVSSRMGGKAGTFQPPKTKRPGFTGPFVSAFCCGQSTQACPGTRPSDASPHQCSAWSPGTKSEYARSFRTPRPAPSPHAPRAAVASPVPSPS